jgi:hypothetical protein
MTYEDFEIAATLKDKPYPTDEELQLLIKTTHCLRSYFRIRGEPLLANIFRQELTEYENIRQVRENKKALQS